MPLTAIPGYVIEQVVTTLLHNWPFLALGILSAAALKVYVGIDRVASLFRAQTSLAVAGSVTAAVATPFCSCGTTAVVLSMLASAVPWAPVVAFMVASPLTSPDEVILSAGLFGWPFALFFLGASIVLGLAGGAVAYVAEGAGLLENQARYLPRANEEIALAHSDERVVAGALPVASTGCGPSCATQVALPAPASACGCSSAPLAGVGPGAAHVSEFAVRDPYRLRELAATVGDMGWRMFALFFGFALVGYLAIAIIPTTWLTTYLGGSSPLSVVLAATLGVPFYFSTEASLPLLASLMHGGMGAGPAMAFLITGAGTSVGAISGGLLIARWRVIAVVVGTLWVGAIVLGLVASVLL